MRKRASISPLLLTLLLLGLSLAVSGQDLDRRISISIKNKTLHEALDRIGAEGELLFSYSSGQIRANQRVSVAGKRERVGSILDRLAAQAGFSYKVVENQVVLKGLPAAVPVKEDATITAPRNHSLSGFLKDAATGEALIGANVYIRDPLTGTTTNAYGYYSLTLPAGNYTIVASFVGYESREWALQLDRDQTLTASLKEARLEIKEVEVKAESGAGPAGVSPGELRFSRKTLQQLPGFGGDVDVIRSLQAIPGITSYGDGSTFFYVRGGGSDQNLILIDEAPIYNPTHLFGFFSALSPDAVNDVQVYKGDFPAGYGGRLSSVIDIHARNGNLNRFGFSGNIGPYASTLTLEGPIVKNKSSFLVSGRVSTLNWVNSINTGLNRFDFSFYDLNAKLNYRINPNNRVYLTFYYGNDAYSRPQETSIETYGIAWNNMAGSLRWNHLFSKRLFSNTTAYASRYHYYLYLSEPQNDYWRSTIANISVKTDFTWFLNPRNTLKSGLEITSHYSDPGNVTLEDNPGSQPAPSIAKYQSVEYAFYLSNEQKLWKRLTLSYGIRLPVWQNLGPTSVYKFNEGYQVIDTVTIGKNESYYVAFDPEPRISLQYDLNAASCLKAGYSRTVQYTQVVSNSVSPFTAPEVWVPSGPNVDPQKADQFTLGYFLQAFHRQIHFSAEAYYKNFIDHLDYEDHANLLYNPLLEGELRSGKAWSYGIELLVRKPEGQWTGWLGYTWSRAWVQTPGVNDGKSYPAFYDRPHNLTANLTWKPGMHWEVSGNFIWASGNAITTPVGFFEENGVSVPIYGEKNNDRLPDYLRLDLSAAWIISKPENRYQHSLRLTLYNALGNLNPYTVSFNRYRDADGNYVVPSNLWGNYTLVPTTLSVSGIIPSLNYQFKF